MDTTKLWLNTGLTTIGNLQKHIINQARGQLDPSKLWKYDYDVEHIHQGKLTFQQVDFIPGNCDVKAKLKTVDLLPIITSLFLTDTNQD